MSVTRSIRPSSTFRRGFTLVELLVVIAILAVLAALLFPVFGTATFRAKNTVCRNDLRQISLALQMYATTYDIYPPLSQLVGGDGLTSTELYWDQYLEPYLFPKKTITPYLYASGHGGPRTVEKFLLCPFFPATMVNRPFDDSKIPPIYAYNSMRLGNFDVPLGLGAPNSLYRLMYPGINATPWTTESAVVAPSEMLAVGDPFTRSVRPRYDGVHQSSWSFWKPLCANRPGATTDLVVRSRAVVKLHRARVNRIFCDGHLEAEDFGKTFDPSDDYLRRWNYDHEPHRKIWETARY
jgi:prepilin-type N-terminal cleavage/methylation domain-containing protein